PTHYDGSKGTTVYYSVDGEPEKSIDITQTEQEITIDIPDDLIYDPEETLTVSLHPGAYILDTDNQSATVTIEDNEPVFSIEKVKNGTEKEQNPQFRITQENPETNPNKSYSVEYTIDHKDSNNSDFLNLISGLNLISSDTVNFPGSEGSKIYDVELKDDNLVESQEEFDIKLVEEGSYGVKQETAEGFILKDNEPRLNITKEKDSLAEGEDNNVKHIFTIDFQDAEGEAQPAPQEFDLNLTIGGDAVRGSFADTQKGSDYKLFYTIVKDDGDQNQKAFADPESGKNTYKLKVPAETTKIKLQVEDINDELFETDETIQVTLEESDETTNSQTKIYKLLNQKTATAKLKDNEPTVSLGEVVNPTEGFGFGSTIAGLEDAIVFENQQSISVPANDNLNLAQTGEFTQEAWIFPNVSDKGQHGILGSSTEDKQAYPSISIINETSVKIGFGDGDNWNSKTVEDVINPNAWNHVATTFDGTDYKLYVNAVEVFSTSDFANKLPAATKQLEIGKAGNSYFEGAIDEVRIWDTARNASQIQSLMTSQLEGQEEGLVGYWNFNGKFNGAEEIANYSGVFPLGQGWLSQYYNYNNFEEGSNYDPDFTRLDSSVSEDWKLG
ncbi:LamG domain-containing protein, partial [Geitlerinema sp. PCC 9228]|uniref:LamG domain-containing protein n=1 Tax=Geitlerinema sp. PCC 9228 TaxID=111611 RepID=UPI000A8352F6